MSKVSPMLLLLLYGVISQTQASNLSFSVDWGASWDRTPVWMQEHVVPRRCARCRAIQNREDFLDCLDRCMSRPSYTPDRSPSWSFDSIRRKAFKSSDNGFNTRWGKREYGEIALYKDWDRPTLSFSIGSLSFDPFAPQAEIIINGRSYGMVSGNVKGSNTLEIQNPRIIDAMRYARKVEMKVTPWDHTPLHFHYSLGRDFGHVLRQCWDF